jgi:hypothetical protein
MANEFVIKNGYFSQGNSNVTGSLQVTGSVGVTGSASVTGSLTSIGTSTFSGSVLMTGSLNAIVSGAIDLTGFITASKILITSSGTNQFMVMGSGSSSWITGIYGSQGNLLTITDTMSGSIFTISDISGYPILDITSDYYTGSVYLPTLQSQSQQYVVVYNSQSGLLSYMPTSAIGGDPFPYTGSAEITGSLIVSGGFLVHALGGANQTVIDSNNSFLIDTGGNTSVDWSGRSLLDVAGTSTLSWGSTILNDTLNAYTSIDWTQRYLYADDGSTIQIEWWDPAGIILPSITTNPLDSILGIDAGGRVCYTASSAIGGGGSGTPGGSNKQIQFNANGAFSGSSNFTFDSSSNTVEISGSLTISGSGTFTNIGPAVFSGSVTLTQGFTGSLLGTASYVTGSVFSSTNPALSASYALTASYAANAGSTFNSTSSVLGNGLSSSFNINHGFNTLNLHITVYSASGTYETVYPDIRRVNANTASIVFANPPLTNEYIVYISQ